MNCYQWGCAWAHRRRFCARPRELLDFVPHCWFTVCGWLSQHYLSNISSKNNLRARWTTLNSSRLMYSDLTPMALASMVTLSLWWGTAPKLVPGSPLPKFQTVAFGRSSHRLISLFWKSCTSSKPRGSICSNAAINSSILNTSRFLTRQPGCI